MNAQDLIAGGLAGASVAFLGSLAISLLRSPKLLDDNRASEISNRDAALATQQEKIAQLEAIPKKHPADEHKLAHVRSLLMEFSDEERDFIKWLLQNGETARDKLAAAPCPEPSLWSAHDKGTRNGLLTARIERTPGGEKHFASVNPSYIEALRDVLFDRSPVTPPSA